MENMDVNALKLRMDAVLPALNEYPRRRYPAAEAKSLGRGGITLVSRLTGVSRQTLTNEIGKGIQVLHYPPGTSKWNKIEHRMFSFISKNWQGIPLISAAVIVNLIGATKTKKGLSITCVLDEGTYERGIEVTDDEFDSINIESETFHGEWNYSIRPNTD